MTNMKVTCVEEARQEVHRQEASRACETSRADSPVSVGFSTMTEKEASQEIGFASVIEGPASEVYWTAIFVLVIEDATSQIDWTAGFDLVTEDATSQTDWTPGLTPMKEFTDPFSIVIEGEASQEDWSADEVEDPVKET
jgi:hypothetical protein